jgi:cyclophilin family peptidyl-prolyl cis-trans isomerase
MPRRARRGGHDRCGTSLPKRRKTGLLVRQRSSTEDVGRLRFAIRLSVTTANPYAHAVIKRRAVVGAAISVLVPLGALAAPANAVGAHHAAAVGARHSAAPAKAKQVVVRFHTTFGNIDVKMLTADAPKNVANFMRYVKDGSYKGTIFSRSVKHFVVQGGGFDVKRGNIDAIPAKPPVVNEYKVSNTRGTLAMVKSARSANSATNQWFFNESNHNAKNLDSQYGGYTVIGKITSKAGLKVLDKIAKAKILKLNPPLTAVPVRGHPTRATVTTKNLIFVKTIKVLKK